MSDLNEQVNVLVEDASVITVPIDTTLTNSGEAADAKAVGDALALKADIASVVTISVNGESADNQGAILIDGGDIPVSSDDATKLDVAIGALQAKDASTIIFENTETIKDHVDAIDAGTVHVSAQTLTTSEQEQARSNISAVGTAALNTPTAISPTINTTNFTLGNNDCCVIGSLVIVSLRVTTKAAISMNDTPGITLPAPLNTGGIGSVGKVCYAANTIATAWLQANGEIVFTEAVASGVTVAFTFVYPSTLASIASFIPS